MISVRAALDLVLSDLPRVGTEHVALPQAAGRVLAEAVRASRDVPPFRNAAMDGYAVRAADVTAADAQTPVILPILEVVGAGAVPQHPVVTGTATKIMTGSLMPDGADAVVRVEDTEERDGRVHIRAGVVSGAHVRHPGEDMRGGETVLTPGRELRPADIGLLASLGVAVVPVTRRPAVAILATGDELADLGQPLGPGQIVNSNAYTLAAAVEEAGATPRLLGIVRDTPEATRAAFREALASDMVLSTGGVSMGTFDLVRQALAELGVVERFWKVAQKPGKPLTFGVRERVPVFGLPGNPVSSLVCFYVYVRPALRAMMGLDHLHLPTAAATADQDIKTAPGLTEFVRCVLDGAPGAYRAGVTGSQSSGVLRSMSLGQGLIIAPPEVATITRGSAVRVMLLNGDAVAESAVSSQSAPQHSGLSTQHSALMLRIGHGYDIHRLVEGRLLVLGGVEIPYPRGLLGHSDGDVVLHAVCDAILGAMAGGDIGQHFPDSDERYHGIPSSELLRHVAALMRDEGWRIGNLDVTICVEQPRLASHRQAMRSRIAELLDAPVTAVSVKAKTNEGLDAVGRGEAIAATAVVLLEESTARL
ncbi:MAG TPA: gephyrin-like molybdotransferase Glp [Candidatus Acidoferrales bacterium]|nr:gephyrin-like molybdotransferase Glp [Candidatus Acidoferrales bacterium]